MTYRLVKVDSLGGLTEGHLATMESLEMVPGERDLGKPRLDFIRELIVSETFNRCEWGTCHCKEDGKTYRVNGQHTSKVLGEVLDGALDGASFPEGVPVTMSCYECDTITDLADVFDQFDQHKSTRKPEDKLGIFMAQHRDLIGIDKKLCGKVLAGIDWGVKHVPSITELCSDYVPREAYDRGLLLNVDAVREFIDVMHQQDGAPFKEWQQKSGIIARLFDLFITDRDNAELAIEQTMFEAGEVANDFTRRIRQSCARTGKDQGYYYRATDKYMKVLLKNIADLGREAIKAMIREVMAEEEPEEEAVTA